MLEPPSIDHLPDITRCAASATASAISEPSLVALDIMLLAACRRGVGGIEAGVADRAARLRAGADRRCRSGEAGGEHFLAHRGLGELVDVSFDLEDELEDELCVRILPSLHLPRVAQKDTSTP